MEDKKFDITSTAIEKGIDLIGGFIEKLAGSALEEAGLYFGDKVRVRRLKNQIEIFSKAKQIAEENNISIKQIDLKILVPLLEFSSLEEDETLQQKWSNLIVSFSDASENYESSIFPFILNQLTKDDIEELELLYHNGYYRYSPKLNSTGIVKANLTRLGLVELSIHPHTNIPKNNFYQITELGYEFYKCCTRDKNINEPVQTPYYFNK